MNFLSNPFFYTALLGAFAASIAGGLVGSYVVIKRIVFISGSIAHAVLGGMGLTLFLKRSYHLDWLNPVYGAFVFSILAALLIGYIKVNYKQREDTIIGAIWAFGMALGVIFLSLTPGYNVEVMHFLFGNILWTTSKDILILAGLDVLIIATTLIFHRRFLAICFDEEGAKLQGANVSSLYFLLLSLTAVTVVILTQVVGVILVIALLSLPAAIANRFTRRISSMMILSCLIGMVVSLLGLSMSFSLNWPSGASIAILSTVAYFLTLGVKKN